jgi:hypothetical protein
LLAGCLVALGEAGDERPQPGRVVDDAQTAPCLDHQVVPGRHHLACSAFEAYQLGET